MEMELLNPKFYWMIETNSAKDPQSMFEELDLPITSRVFTFTTMNTAAVTTVTEVYRPAPYLDIR